MTTQFASASTDAGSRAGSRFWPGFSAGLCAATIVAAGVATVDLLSTRVATDVIDVAGTVTLVEGAVDTGTVGFPCTGGHGYDDLSPAASVQITDRTGRLLATGSFTRSAREGAFCTFYFNVPDVPRGTSNYRVEISHRGSVPYHESELDAGVHLTLGR